MRKVIKIGFPIVCVGIIIGTFILLDKTTDKINRTKLNENEVISNSENIENSNFEDNNIVQNDVAENTINNENIINVVNNTLSQDEIKVQEVKNKSKAIEIVKKKAPVNTDCYYTNEGIENGKYLVAIRDSKTKKVRIYYSVDIQTEEIKLYVK